MHGVVAIGRCLAGAENAGGACLTARERELLLLLRDGLTNQEIADRLVISTGTVRSHLENIFAKLGVHTRTAAVARSFSNIGWTDPA